MLPIVLVKMLVLIMLLFILTYSTTPLLPVYHLGINQSFLLLSIYGTQEIYFVNSEKSNRTFWRESALSTVRDTKENLHLLSSHLYPDLYFCTGVWDGIDSFEGGYSSVYQKLKKTLRNIQWLWLLDFSTPPPAVHISDN